MAIFQQSMTTPLIDGFLGRITGKNEAAGAADAAASEALAVVASQQMQAYAEVAMTGRSQSAART